MLSRRRLVFESEKNTNSSPSGLRSPFMLIVFSMPSTLPSPIIQRLCFGTEPLPSHPSYHLQRLEKAHPSHSSVHASSNGPEMPHRATSAPVAAEERPDREPRRLKDGGKARGGAESQRECKGWCSTPQQDSAEHRNVDGVHGGEDKYLNLE